MLDTQSERDLLNQPKERRYYKVLGISDDYEGIGNCIVWIRSAGCVETAK